MQPIPPQDEIHVQPGIAANALQGALRQLQREGWVINEIFPTGGGYLCVVATRARDAAASGACEQSPESMALDLARELVRQEEEGGRVQRICECKGSALVNAKDLPQHRRGKKSPCLYAMAVDVLVQAGEREKGVKQS